MTLSKEKYNKKTTPKGIPSGLRGSFLRQRMLEDMQLRSFSENTQDRYIKGVRKLSRHYKRSPEKISENEVRDFILNLIKESGLAPDTIRVTFYGIKFLYQNTLRRNWKIFDLIRLPQPKHLPVVLSYEEVRNVLSHIWHPTYRMALTLIYACGLRLSECLNLRVKDIDSDRMVVKVKGKGNKERFVMLTKHVLDLLRHYWRLNCLRPWLEERDSQKTERKGLLKYYLVRF